MGQLDSPLTLRGERQAQAIARRLQEEGPFVLYSSDLGRAWQTAEQIAQACQVTIHSEPRLRERLMGIFQGWTIQEAQEKFPDVYEKYAEYQPDYAVPGGESVLERTERSVQVLTELAQRHPSETVVVVTHGNFLLGFFEHVLGLPRGRALSFRRDNAAYSAFDYQEGIWTLLTWNDRSHLRALDAEWGQGEAASVEARKTSL